MLQTLSGYSGIFHISYLEEALIFCYFAAYFLKYKVSQILECLLFQIFGSMVSNEKKEKGSNFTKIDVTLNQKVVVTKSFYPTVEYANLLPKIGGALGLWLGIGVVQLFSFSVNFLSVLNNVLSALFIKETIK